MPDFNIDDLSAKFGGDGVSSAPTPMFNVDDLASKFGGKASKSDDKTPSGLTKVYIVKPPISDLPKDQSDAINAEPGIQGGANPRDTALSEGIRNYVPAIAGAVADQAIEGGKNFSGGLGDIVNQGELGPGAKRMAVGAMQAATSIPSAIASEGVGKPLTELTGNPDFGDKAAFLAGSAIPILPGSGVVLGKPLNSIVGTVNKVNPSKVALKDLTDIITNNGANPENLVPVVQGMKANPRLGPADLNPAVLSTTQKLFTTEGDAAKNYLAKTSADRMATSPHAVEAAYDASTGLPVNAVEKLKALSDAAKKVGNNQINPAVAGAKPVNINDTLAHIDSQLKPGVASKFSSGSTLPFPEVKEKLGNLRNWLANKNEQRTGAQDLHDFQSALRRHADALLQSADGGQRQLGHALMNVRGKLVDDIDKAGPKITVKDENGVEKEVGQYKHGLSNYRDEKNIAEAFHDAYNGVFSSSKKLENRPEFTKEWLDGLTEHEIGAAREGARLAIDSQIRLARNPALAGTNLVKSDFNKQKLQMLFGKEETASLLQKLEHERLISNTHNKVVENAQTAFRLAGERRIKVSEPTPPSSGSEKLMRLASWIAPEAANFYGTGYAIPGIGLAASMAANAVHKYGTAAKDSIKIALEKERNLQLAKNALPTQGPRRDALIKSLQDAIPGPKQSLVTKAAGLARLVSP